MVLPIVLLCALPASGKSEVRNYLDNLDEKAAVKDFHMGESVQLDDFPYVHIMRVIDIALLSAGHKNVFFKSNIEPFADSRDWGTLIELLNEDYFDMINKTIHKPENPSKALCERIDAAGAKVGIPNRLSVLSEDLKKVVYEQLAYEAQRRLDEKHKDYPETMEGKTLVIEFARGGPAGSPFPIPEPFGYQYSVSRLVPEILEKASMLYIWVTPEESKRKNKERDDPNDPGSNLNHCVPDVVMENDYGTDDINYLLEVSKVPGKIQLESTKVKGKVFDIPVSKFDNRVDCTSFLREKDPKKWKAEDVAKVHDGLKAAMQHLAE